MFSLKCDYEIKFKATKKLFNLFKIRRTHNIRMDIEELQDNTERHGAIDIDDNATELEELSIVIGEYAKIKNLIDVKVISYTRYIR